MIERNTNLYLMMLRRIDYQRSTDRSPFFCNVTQPNNCDIPGLLQSELDNTIIRNVR